MRAKHLSLSPIPAVNYADRSGLLKYKRCTFYKSSFIITSVVYLCVSFFVSALIKKIRSELCYGLFGDIFLNFFTKTRQV